MNYEGIRRAVRYWVDKLDIAREDVWRNLTDYVNNEEEARELAREVLCDLYPC